VLAGGIGGDGFLLVGCVVKIWWAGFTYVTGV